MGLQRELEKASKLQPDTVEMVSQTQETRATFILQQLAVGLTFVHLAHQSVRRGHPEDSERQKIAAREALDTALKLLPDATPTPHQKAKIDADLAELDSKLKAMGG